jgi:hypothetical protein
MISNLVIKKKETKVKVLCRVGHPARSSMLSYAKCISTYAFPQKKQIHTKSISMPAASHTQFHPNQTMHMSAPVLRARAVKKSILVTTRVCLARQLFFMHV